MKAGKKFYWVLHENVKIGCCCFQVYGDWDEKFLCAQCGVQKSLLLKSKQGCMEAILKMSIAGLV